MISLPLAFLRRDLLIWTSYRMSAMGQVLGVLTFAAVCYFVGASLGNQPGLISGQSGSYVAFLLSGIAFTDCLAHGISSVSQAISTNQQVGTLEPVLLMPVGRLSLLFGSSIFKLTLALARTASYLLIGVLVFGLWHSANVLSLALVFIPAMATYLALGTLSAAFVIVVKQGDPVLLAYSWGTGLLSGALFPIALLPSWAQPLSLLVPLTYALTGIRAALDGAPPADVAGPALALAVMAGVLGPVGIVAFTAALRRARREGSLAQY